MSIKHTAGLVPALFLIACFFGSSITFAQSSEITLYAGGFLGDSFILTPPVLSGPVESTLDDDFTIGGRYAYFFTSQLAMEFGIGFTPANIVVSGNAGSGSTNVQSAIDVNTYVLHANLTAHLIRTGPVIPYATGGVGAVHFDYAVDRFGFLTPSETDFALNAGGGFKVPFRRNTALRFDSRFYWVNSEFAREDTSRFVEITGGVSVLFDF